jgi:hypothetical protein
VRVKNLSAHENLYVKNRRLSQTLVTKSGCLWSLTEKDVIRGKNRRQEAEMQSENVSIGRKRRIFGKILVNMGGVMLIGSAAAKLAHVPQVVNQLGAMGFDGGRLTFIAVLEVVSAVLFLIPVTRSLGLLLVSSFLGGAIATHLQHGQPVYQPAFMLFLIWLGVCLRHPQVLWSLAGNKSGTQGVAQSNKAPQWA